MSAISGAYASEEMRVSTTSSPAMAIRAATSSASSRVTSCATATGQSVIYDWVYDNRAIHLKKLSELGANIQLMDAHRLLIIGPTRWRGRRIESPPALRPAVCLLLAALAARGTTTLMDVYVINRGYEDLPQRLNKLGASINTFWGEPADEN